MTRDASAPAAMDRRIPTLLYALYGPGEAGRAAARLAEALDRFRAEAAGRPPPRAPGRLTERDALLITYADQVRESGAAPLATIGSFARAHLTGMVSGIHLLPFYPSSSDDGFAVMDYGAVDPDSARGATSSAWAPTSA